MITDTSFDFNAELNKLILDNSSSNDEHNRCPISKDLLDDTMIKLECGHIFNYEPLYNEIIKQKYGYRTTEIVKLQPNQIKCPYCRNIQNTVLPYAPELKVKKVVGINSPAKWQMLNDQCIYTSNHKRSQYFNTPCNMACWGKFCKKHKKLGNRKLSGVNTILSNPSEQPNNGCKCILKYGSRKGELCNKSILQDDKCKRHYNLLNK
jgi:hypothetical protein